MKLRGLCGWWLKRSLKSTRHCHIYAYALKMGAVSKRIKLHKHTSDIIYYALRTDQYCDVCFNKFSSHWHGKKKKRMYVYFINIYIHTRCVWYRKLHEQMTFCVPILNKVYTRYKCLNCERSGIYFFRKIASYLNIMICSIGKKKKKSSMGTRRVKKTNTSIYSNLLVVLRPYNFWVVLWFF